MENRSIKPDKTVLKSLGQCSFAGNSLPSAVDIKDGKILRIRLTKNVSTLPIASRILSRELIGTLTEKEILRTGVRASSKESPGMKLSP